MSRHNQNNSPWTPELTQRLHEVYHEGHTYRHIAELIGVTYDAVKHKIDTEGLSGSKFTLWTAEVVAQLLVLKSEGLNYRAIAARLGGGITRDAVSAQVMRLRDKGVIEALPPRLEPEPVVVDEHTQPVKRAQPSMPVVVWLSRPLPGHLTLR